MNETYEWSGHRHGSPLISSLDHRRIQPRHCVGQGAEITCHETMCREVLVQHVEELHQPRGDVLGYGELLAEWWRGANATKEPRAKGAGKGAPGCSLADAQEASSNRVELRVEVFVKLAVRIDQHSTLLGKLGAGVVTDGVVSEIIKHLERKEKAGRMHICVPVKDRSIDDLNAISMTLGAKGVQQVFRLQVCECRRNLDDLVLSALINLVVGIADKIQNVQHHCPVSSAHLVDYQVMVRIQRELVIGDQIPSDCLSVIWPEELGRCMPQLPRDIGLLLIK